MSAVNGRRETYARIRKLLRPRRKPMHSAERSMLPSVESTSLSQHPSSKSLSHSPVKGSVNGRHDAFADRRPLPRIDLTNSGCIELLFADRKLKLRGHSDQFCQRFSLHFPCHVSSLDLHGDFAGPEFETDLFIEHTQNY